MRIGKPGRHFSRGHLFANGFGPWPGLVKRQEGHGRNLSGAVALLAMRLEDGKNVFVEDRLGDGRGRRKDKTEYKSQRGRWPRPGGTAPLGTDTNEPAKQRIYRGTPGSKNGRSGLPPFP
jgi:hypothetical protein